MIVDEIVKVSDLDFNGRNITNDKPSLTATSFHLENFHSWTFEVKFLGSFFVDFNFYKVHWTSATPWTWIDCVCDEKFAQEIVKLRIFVAILFFVALEKRPFSLCRVAYDESYVVPKVNLVKLRRDLILWSESVR